MGLSRLDNFLKSVRGTIIYVDPGSLDSTDSIENSGNSLTRPFKTLQRALIEAARFSYQRGLSNDRFNKTTILLYPGDHLVDNRPGYIPTGGGTFSARSGSINLTDLTQWDLDTNFDLSAPNNTLYKLNSVYGGVIVPRGTSIVGLDLRKTKIRPTYVPDPENDDIERSCIFRVTGACYFWQFTILDSDPNGNCYKDYTTNLNVPNFSHHKLAGFEYADGVNGVEIDDAFLNGANAISTTRTDLDMYYEKVVEVYGPSSNREIGPDYGVSVVDLQPVIDEYRIVGSKGGTARLQSIKAGDGITSNNTVTVQLVEPLEGLSVDSPIKISGVSAEGYDGQYVVYTVISDTEFTYQVQNPPLNPNPGIAGASLSLVVDTVTSASPYIFNCSLRSVYGMCGLIADGDKATGFQSMVVAQYTGIGLQKDDNAFVKYDPAAGEYKTSRELDNLSTDSRARFKPNYQNFHIKAKNDSFLQLVSVFAIGYAQHFVTETGGDIALNNSNSNFGAKSLVADGFKRFAFNQDDFGYVTHIIPPKEIEAEDTNIEFYSLDVGVTTFRSAGAGTTTKLYLYNETNENIPPKIIIDGYHIGAKENDRLSVQVYESGITTTYSSRIVMPSGPNNATQFSSEKLFTVLRSVSGINSIVVNTFTLTEPHGFINGESVRVIAENGHLPDGLESNQVYYAITSGIGTNEVRIAQTLDDAINGSEITVNNKGGTLNIVSRVSDKNAGDLGHPIQWDEGGYWYLTVDSADNQIYSKINAVGIAGLGNATNRAYITRTPSSRSLIDTLYRVRYVLPKDSPFAARPPIEGFILQESNNIIGSGSTDITQLYNTSGAISNSNQIRNSKFIAGASWSGGQVTVTSEVPHELSVGDEVEIVNVVPDDYNGTYVVTSLVNSKSFTYALSSNPGTFGNSTSTRDETLPYFKRKKYLNNYQVYKAQEIQPYVENVQDGVYYLTLISNASNPTVTPFREQSFAQPIENLYPQVNKDNPQSDPKAAKTHALPDPIGKVVIDEPQHSLTKTALETFAIGFGVTDIQSSSGIAHTIYTSIDHGLSGITTVSIITAGSNYGTGTSGDLYNAQLVGFAGSTTGSNATAKISLGPTGNIIGVKIIDGGSAYGIGNTLRVIGVATTGGHVVGVVKVEAINNSVDDTVRVSGVSSVSNEEYNTLYRVTGSIVGKPKELNVISSKVISNISVAGLGSAITSEARCNLTGRALAVSSFDYDSVTGLATVGFTTSHGFRVDNKIRIGGANESVFNGDFIVKKLNSLTSLIVNVGIETNSTVGTGTIYTYRPTLTSYAGDLISDTESVSGRLTYQYAGITTVLRTSLFTTDPDTTDLQIPNAVALGLNLGDYLLIDNEIFRIKTAVTSDSVPIFRSVLGTPRQTHISGSVVRRIKVIPVELRRNSIIRASGHTFEYLGYGPGNYSTSLPDKQDRTLSTAEEFLAQATKTSGGIVVYTGMNSDGDFFIGNQKINSATGKIETYDTPIPSITGEKTSDTVVNITDTQKLFVGNSIKVDGGRDKNIVSEFDGPVVFNNKLTSNADIEANSVFIQGSEDVSRKISISKNKPNLSANYGDIIFNSEPSKNEFIGWTYLTENSWEPFGFVGSPGVGLASAGNYVGFATLINLNATGIKLATQFNSSGIATISFDANPRVAISSGVFNTFVGLASQLNFVGYGVTLTTDFDSNTGIATVTIVGVTSDGVGTPNLPNRSLQFNNDGDFGGVPLSQYDDINNRLVFGGVGDDSTSIYVNNAGYLGFSSASPSSKLEVVADNERAIYIKSRQGVEILRIDNTDNDTTPFLIDALNRVGINTDNPITELDVGGTVSIGATLRLYEANRSNYVGLSVTTLNSNITFNPPTTYGNPHQVLATNGSGTLGWKSVSNQEVIAGSGITISYATVGSGITVATIANSGIRSITAGNNIQISVVNGVGIITSTAEVTVVPNYYSFTTKGFSMPI